jgi:hypothetical protein
MNGMALTIDGNVILCLAGYLSRCLVSKLCQGLPISKNTMIEQEDFQKF